MSISEARGHCVVSQAGWLLPRTEWAWLEHMGRLDVSPSEGGQGLVHREVAACTHVCAHSPPPRVQPWSSSPDSSPTPWAPGRKRGRGPSGSLSVAERFARLVCVCSVRASGRYSSHTLNSPVSMCCGTVSMVSRVAAPQPQATQSHFLSPRSHPSRTSRVERSLRRGVFPSAGCFPDSPLWWLGHCLFLLMAE